MRTIDDVIRSLKSPDSAELPTPPYEPTGFGPNVGLAVKSMARHSTDEGWQLFQALEAGGYTLFGHGIGPGFTDASYLVSRIDPGTIVIQDKREWEGLTAGGPKGFDPRERFTNVDALARRPDVFKLTVLKDAHQQPGYHRQSADEIGAHGWVVYYHPRIVKHLAPYVRERHLVRTYHTVDREIVPPYSADGRRNQAFLSGAISGAYPLRKKLHQYGGGWLHYRMHPGYHRRGADTPEYLKALSHYKVAICTSSIYGYATRKIVEATAAGCVVVTDLPSDDVLPVIDANLVRVDPSTDPLRIARLCGRLADGYEPVRQKRLAEAAKEWYDYRATGKRLAADIETLRSVYP